MTMAKNIVDKAVEDAQDAEPKPRRATASKIRGWN